MEIIKMLLSLCFLTFCSVNVKSQMELLSKFHQNDYKMKFERLELQYHDKKLFDKFQIVTFKYNRTTAVSNITFVPKVDLDKADKWTVIVQMYKFLSNEYRRIAVRYQVNFCNSITSDMMGLSKLITSGNFSSICSFKKGLTYHAYNFAPLESKFPLFIPNGDYKLEFNVMADDNLILTILGLSKVYRPII